MQLGISSYTFTWAIGVPGSMPSKPLSAYDLVDKAYSYGLHLVQIADNLPIEVWEEKDIVNLRDYAAGRNVGIEMGGRCLTHDHTMKCLRAAELLQSSILRMVIDGKDFEPGPESVVEIVRKLVPELKSRRIKLAIENHDRLKAHEFEKIILSAKSEYAGICLDSVNSMGAGEGFATVSEILLPYTINLHIKDFSIKRVSHKMGFVIEGTPAGKGMLNIEALVRRLKDYGKCGSAILELWTPPAETIDLTVEKEELWAAESIAYLKQFFLI
jgi:sugar phosphate isomerase/epimerase